MSAPSAEDRKRLASIEAGQEGHVYDNCYLCWLIARLKEEWAAERTATIFMEHEHLMNAEAILEREGYRRCDAPACNCNSYHKRASARVR